MTDPPLELPALHVRPRFVAVRSDVFSARLIGASELVIIVAPLPVGDASEIPLTFVTTTLASTLVFRLNEYGAAVRVDKGTVHCVAEMIVLSVPSQLIKSSE